MLSVTLPRARRTVASPGLVGRARPARLRLIHRAVSSAAATNASSSGTCRRLRTMSCRARASPSLSAAKAAAARSALVACASAAAALATAGSVRGGGGARPIGLMK